MVSDNGILYVIGGRSARTVAVRAGGRGHVTETHRLWVAKVGANVSSPSIHDGHLYWVNDRNKTAYCIRLKDGEIMYEKRFGGQPYASTLLADGKVYIVTRHSVTFGLAAKPKYEELSHNKLNDDSTFNATPIVTHNRLYLRSDKFLYCIGKKS